MILGLHHTALSVPDFAAALDFYCGKLGFEPVMEVDIPGGVASVSRALGIEDSACKLTMLKKGNSCIEIFEFPASETSAGDPERPVNRHGITHLCLATDDYEADYAALKATGAVFNTAPEGAAPMRWAYCRDPFGNVIELLKHWPEGPTAISFDS